MIIGYTAGVFDLLHIGHLNLLRNAKGLCDYLIVGVSKDEYVMKYKKKKPIITFQDRAELVRGLKFVDAVIPQVDGDRMEMYNKLKFNVMFVGDDWYQSEKWSTMEQDFKNKGVDIVFFPYTDHISTTKINALIKDN